jgi:hypothetical protein
MLVAFFSVSLSDANLTLADVAVCILSGKEVLLTRALSQALSWIPAFREVFIVSDEFPNTTRSDIESASPHANIRFVEISGRAEHIIGSEWLLPWYRAQPRFLPGMHHLWVSNPNASWYIFCDDDTYLFPKSLLRKLAMHNASKPEVISRFWCSWNQITEFMRPPRDCHLFAQGGSGVMFSRAIMATLGPRLIECSEKYNDAEHAASMRVAVCIERIYGYDMWSAGQIITDWKTALHPGRANTAIAKLNTWEAPASFHQVSPNEMIGLKHAHWADGGDGWFDFNFFAMKSVPVHITYRRVWQLHFGFAIDNFGTHSQRLFSTTDFITSDGGKTFLQQFDGNISVIVVCDQGLREEQIKVDDVERGPNVTIHLAIKCPPKEKYHRN